MDTLEKFRKDETRRLICWIRKNKNRMEKELYTELDQGANVIHYSGINRNN